MFSTLQRLAANGFILNGGLVLVGSIYEPFMPYAVGLVMLVILISWIIQGYPLRPSPLNLPLLIFLIPVALSLAATALPAIAFPQTLRLLAGLLLCLSVFNSAQSRSRLAILLGTLLLLALALASAAILSVDWAAKFHFLPNLPVEVSAAINPNVMAGTLLLLLSGLLAFLVFRWFSLRLYLRITLILISIFIFGVLFLTQSRSSLIGLAVVITLLVLLRFRHGKITVTIALFIIGFGVLYLGPQQVWDVISQETGGTASLSRREDIWLRAKLLIADFPLTGVGMGTFGEVMDRLYPLASEPVHINHAHNLYLQIAADLGLPGLAAWLGCWLTVIWMAWKLYRNKDPYFQSLGATVVYSQVAFGVNGLFDALTWDTRPAMIVWVIWGLTVAAWDLSRRRQSS